MTNEQVQEQSKNWEQDNGGKVVLITGAATGIGRATAEKFVASGYSVSLCDCNQTALAELEQKLKAQVSGAQQVFSMVVDVKDHAALNRWADASVEHLGKISAFFANAGIHRSNTLLNITDEELHEMVETNVYGTVYALKAVVPHMIKAGGGAIVLNDSEQFFIGKSNNFGYGLTKGALGQITRSLSVELGPHNIRINAVCPSTIRTPLAEQAMERWSKRDHISLDEAWAEENSLFQRGYAGTAQEVAEFVFFLIDKATFCTGAHYLLDGGLVAH